VPPSDPFDTASLRRTVLGTWAASPARFREDANAEEDYALGGYRDRVITELAQNAADAASRAGVPGRLRLTLDGPVLTAANTGAPLDADGVEALSTLRASSKRHEGAVGRFGVGFAATVAVSDEPSIASATGAVRWSRAETRALAADIPALAAELDARDSHVPVLRLPFASAVSPGTGTPPDGFATQVTLPLRDAAALDLVTRLLEETGPALLLALPALTEVTFETPAGTRSLTSARSGDRVVIADDGAESVWHVTSAAGSVDPGLLADRPTEERARPAYSLRWACRTDSPGSPVLPALPPGVPAVIHAPTPTDEPLGLPAILLATFPLTPDRRHVAPGPLTDFLVSEAARTYADFLPELASAGADVLNLVPGPVAEGALDGQLRRAITARLPETPFLPAADGALLRPRDALVLDVNLPSLREFLAPVLAGLAAGSPRQAAFRSLGVRRLSLAELADLLATLERPPSWWREAYESLSGASPEQRAELGALPVPLADGRLVRGPRGLLLPGPGLSRPDRLSALGLRIVDPAAAHPLLARLGAVEATGRSVLADPAAQAAVENSFDSEDPLPVADAVLGLLASVDTEPGEMPWLRNLALPGADGDWYPADELLLPGSPLTGIMADDAPFGVADADFTARHGAEALEKAGVLSTFGLLRASDVDLSEADLDLDAADDWADDTRDRLRGDAGPQAAGVPPFAPELLAVRDLDLVGPAAWPRALDLLSRPPLRAALTEPTRVVGGDGRYADVPSYTAWWLRRNLTVNGQRVGGLRAPDCDPLLEGLYDEVSSSLAPLLGDPEIARALGVRTSLDEVLSEPGGADDLLARLADAARPVSRSQLRSLWTALAAADVLTPDTITPPDRVRAIRGAEVVVADADEVLVLDTPDLWPLASSRPLILAPHDLAFRLADLLDVPLASEEIPGTVESAGQPRPVPAAVGALLPDAPEEYVEHDKLLVDGVSVPWRCTAGEVHATTPESLAAALAWASGQWPLRHLAAAVLARPGDSARLKSDADLDPA